MTYIRYQTNYFNPVNTVIENYNLHPTKCPICENGIDPRFINAVGRYKNHVEVVYQCPLIDCSHLFIALYRRKETAIYNYFIYEHTQPITKRINENFEKIIQRISPIFCEIYNQSLFAESLGLNHISGPGYRKSLEFLIKDYAKFIYSKDQEKFEKIGKTPLSGVIQQYINDSRLIDAASRAAWLGNDETHYIRIWDNADLNDLKTLIKLTINFIDSEDLLKNYKNSMPAKT